MGEDQDRARRQAAAAEVRVSGRRVAPLVTALLALGVLPDPAQRRAMPPRPVRGEDEPEPLVPSGLYKGMKVEMEADRAASVARFGEAAGPVVERPDLLNELHQRIKADSPKLRPDQVHGLSPEMRARLELDTRLLGVDVAGREEHRNETDAELYTRLTGRAYKQSRYISPSFVGEFPPPPRHREKHRSRKERKERNRRRKQRRLR